MTRSSLQERFTPPTKIGFLTEAYEVPGRPVVVLIQDLHVNFDAQKNIARLLDFLASRQPFALGVEGAEGPVPTLLLNSVGAVRAGQDVTTPTAQTPLTSSLKREVLEYLMREGEITGAEYFAAMREKPDVIQGVEDGRYYNTHRDLFRKTQVARQELVEQLTGFQADLELLVTRTYSKELLKLRAESTHWLTPKEKVDGYMRAMEMVKTPEEKKLWQVEHDLDLLLRIASLQATETEVRAFAPRVEQFLMMAEVLVKNSDVGAVRAVGAVTSQTTPTPLTSPTSLKELLASSIDYYVLAMMRNEPMLERTLALPGETKVLVAGGFHTAPITEMFRKRRISYVVLTPQVKHIGAGDHALYVKRLMGQHLTPEEAAAAGAQAAQQRGYKRLAEKFHWRRDSLAAGFRRVADIGELVQKYVYHRTVRDNEMIVQVAREMLQDLHRMPEHASEIHMLWGLVHVLDPRIHDRGICMYPKERLERSPEQSRGDMGAFLQKVFHQLPELDQEGYPTGRFLSTSDFEKILKQIPRTASEWNRHGYSDPNDDAELAPGTFAKKLDWISRWPERRFRDAALNVALRPEKKPVPQDWDDVRMSDEYVRKGRVEEVLFSLLGDVMRSENPSSGENVYPKNARAGNPASLQFWRAIAQGDYANAVARGRKGLRHEMLSGVLSGSAAVLGTVVFGVPAGLALTAIVLGGWLAYAAEHWKLIDQVKPESGLSPPTASRKFRQAAVLSFYALAGLALPALKHFLPDFPIELLVPVVLLAVGAAAANHWRYDQKIFKGFEPNRLREPVGVAPQTTPSAGLSQPSSRKNVNLEVPDISAHRLGIERALSIVRQHLERNLTPAPVFEQELMAAIPALAQSGDPMDQSLLGDIRDVVTRPQALPLAQAYFNTLRKSLSPERSAVLIADLAQQMRSRRNLERDYFLEWMWDELFRNPEDLERNLPALEILASELSRTDHSGRYNAYLAHGVLSLWRKGMRGGPMIRLLGIVRDVCVDALPDLIRLPPGADVEWAISQLASALPFESTSKSVLENLTNNLGDVWPEQRRRVLLNGLLRAAIEEGNDSRVDYLLGFVPAVLDSVPLSELANDIPVFTTAIRKRDHIKHLDVARQVMDKVMAESAGLPVGVRLWGEMEDGQSFLNMLIRYGDASEARRIARYLEFISSRTMSHGRFFKDYPRSLMFVASQGSAEEVAILSRLLSSQQLISSNMEWDLGAASAIEAVALAVAQKGNVQDQEGLKSFLDRFEHPRNESLRQLELDSSSPDDWPLFTWNHLAPLLNQASKNPQAVAQFLGDQLWHVLTDSQSNTQQRHVAAVMLLKAQLYRENASDSLGIIFNRFVLSEDRPIHVNRSLTANRQNDRWNSEQEKLFGEQLPTLSKILDNPRAFANLMFLLAAGRHAIPYQDSAQSAMAPIEYSESRGVSIPFAESRFVLTTETFRRWVCYRDHLSQTPFAVEFKMPGEEPNRRNLTPSDYDLAIDAKNVRPDADFNPTPVFFRNWLGQAEMYGRQVKAEDVPVEMLAFRYRDRKRLINASPSYCYRIAQRLGIPVEEVQRRVDAGIIIAMLDVQRAGWVDSGMIRRNGSNDSHNGNYGVYVDGSGGSVGDTETFRKDPHLLETPDYRVSQIVAVIAGRHPDAPWDSGTVGKVIAVELQTGPVYSRWGRVLEAAGILSPYKSPASLEFWRAIREGDYANAVARGKKGLWKEIGFGVRFGTLSVATIAGAVPYAWLLPIAFFAMALFYAGKHWTLMDQVKPVSGLSPPTAWVKFKQAAVLSFYALPGLALPALKHFLPDFPIELLAPAALLTVGAAAANHWRYDQKIFYVFERQHGDPSETFETAIRRQAREKRESGEASWDRIDGKRMQVMRSKTVRPGDIFRLVEDEDNPILLLPEVDLPEPQTLIDRWIRSTSEKMADLPFEKAKWLAKAQLMTTPELQHFFLQTELEMLSHYALVDVNNFISRTADLQLSILPWMAASHPEAFGYLRLYVDIAIRGANDLATAMQGASQEESQNLDLWEAFIALRWGRMWRILVVTVQNRFRDAPEGWADRAGVAQMRRYLSRSRDEGWTINPAPSRVWNPRVAQSHFRERIVLANVQAQGTDYVFQLAFEMAHIRLQRLHGEPVGIWGRYQRTLDAFRMAEAELTKAVQDLESDVDEIAALSKFNQSDWTPMTIADWASGTLAALLKSGEIKHKRDLDRLNFTRKSFLRNA